MGFLWRKTELAGLSSTRLQVALRKEELSLMFINRGTFVIKVGLTVILALALVTTCGAAKKAASSSSGKVKVPSAILSGSSLTSGRAFFAQRLPEDTIAGIRLGRPAKEVLSRWGNPSRITVGITQSQGPQGSGMPMTQGIPYTPPQTNAFGGGLFAGVNQAASMVGLQNPAINMGGSAMPSLPGLTAPGMAPPPGAAVGPNSGGQNSMLDSEEVTWTYDLQSGITLEFIVTDGLVTQITVGGSEPWGLSRTRMGLQLGDSYKLVLWVGGYPENQKYVGRFLRVSYVNQNRALFTFLNKRLVGITIAMVPTELN